MWLQRVGSAVAALVATLACAGACSAAAPAPYARSGPPLKMIWGQNTLPDGASAFPVYKRLGVDILQEQLNWARVAPTRPANPTDPNDPAYHWNADTDAAARSGIGVSLLVKETPGWANGGRGVARVPDHDADYTDFLIAATKRYPAVHHWMIWGEPTRAGNFSPMPANSPVGPRRYATLLDASYGALKRASARNVVIGGNTWTVGLVTPPQFVRWMRLPNGRAPRMDLFGHNPFSRRFPDISRDVYSPGVRDISDIDTLHHEIARAYAGRKVPGLWLSEFTISSNHTSRGFDFFVSRSEQARWVTAAFKLVGATSYVAGLGWYDLADESPVTATSLTTGLLDAGGAEKPAFAAYRAAR